MTIGQKLAGYRKLSGMTQQQLGDYLNISAQAISKWEKDLSEPALGTLRVLADLYKVSVDELLDLESGFDVPALAGADEDEKGEKEEAPKEEMAEIIGFCQSCGIKVTEENVGRTQPVVMCKSCVEMKELQRKKAEEAARKQKEEEKRKKDAQAAIEKAKRSRHQGISLIVAGAVTLVFLIIMISSMVNNFSGGMLIFTLVGSYVVFSFVACLFYDCIVQDVVIDWFTKSLNLPGLIFTFDLDGCLWLIGMKILFWVLGLLFGIFAGAIGITLGMICAPFVFPFVIRRGE